ncbi:PP2C family serine/threonine-protein phosphatase [Pelagibius sp. Alg239-R121]|uniref:PP2C family protein-serine/threonine phosphatase n=1 Tax=Pelagibius sp. Alg239-R121 TaxID=2993448 RepID=UPI0024A6BECE|nr:protein phosphatase 2C domain-containing protein [Pelagibius sp. Alg239-R121]
MSSQSDSLWDVAVVQRLGDRSLQEDRAGFRLMDEPASCLLVAADGLGGHRGGDAAAAAAVNAVCTTWESQPEADPAALRRCINQAQESVAKVSANYGNDARTTCVAVVLDSNVAYWSHLGDSRLYGFRQGDTIHRTKDHSVARLMFEMGELSEEEANNGPEQGRLYKSLGPDAAQEFKVAEAPVRPGDGFLLCTDGFWVSLSETEMATAMLAENLEEALSDLAELAVNRSNGHSDNVTVCAARLRYDARLTQ